VFLNTFWILVLPIAMTLDGATRRSPLNTIHSLLLKRIIYTFLASIIHVVLFAALVQILSPLIIDQSLHFSTALAFAISMNLYKYLLIYSVISLVLLKKNK
jgi:hypothetical protein